MQQPQQVQTHHQVVEEIMPDQMSEEVAKEVINQFLPQRKRKPRQPKQPGSKQNPQKIIKLEPQPSGSDIVAVANTQQTEMEQGAEMIVEEQEQIGEMVDQVVTTGTGDDEQQIKEEPQGASVAGTTTSGLSPTKTPKTPKDKSSSKKPI